MSGGGLAIIPAKGQSSRFPGKNLAVLGGRTLLEIAIDKVRESERFARILVSSDDDRILAAGEAAGAMAAPRPAHLARDPVQVGGVCLHVIEQERRAGRDWLWFGIFLVTNPLIRVESIRKAVDLFHESDCRGVASLVPFVHPPQRSFRVAEDGRIEPAMLRPEQFLGAEEYEQLYRHDGGVLVLRTQDFVHDETLFGGDMRSVVLDHVESVDIDTPMDLEWADFVMRRFSSIGTK